MAAPYLETVSLVIHGGSWPNEWIQLVTEMWSDPRCTRKGEGIADYCYDPKIRKDRPSEPHIVGDASICCTRGNADGRRIAFLPKLCLRRWEDTYISKKVDD